ncbi:MAG TPA: hypothetical protein DEG44_04510 [Candidatus Kerfeldbacteria bacterium]|nr:hypothetical protein [Candidatus Kerfeldbacteria bacterium]
MRTHVVLPETTVKRIDQFVDKRKRSIFIQETIDDKLEWLDQQRAFEQAKGAWKNNPKFKTKKSVERYIRNLRNEVDRRSQRYV